MGIKILHKLPMFWSRGGYNLAIRSAGVMFNLVTLTLFRSGTEEEYTELQQLLEDVSTYKRDIQELKDTKAKGRAKRKEKEKEKVEKGLEMREAALIGMTSKFY
jgi:hypothetical protein